MTLQNLESAFVLTWQASWRACVLILAVLIVQALAGKRLPARFRYALGLLVLLRLLVPVTPASNWSVFNLARHVRPPPATSPIVKFAAAPMVMVASPSILPTSTSSRPSHLSLRQWAAVFWLCGATGFLLVVLWRHRIFARWVAQLPSSVDPRAVELVEQCKDEAGVRRALRIASAPPGSSAAVFGFIRPCLLLPEGMFDTLEQREARLVLLHEFFHIRRRDVLVNWISVLALALHWFNPLAWVALRRLRADQELACDAQVLGLIEQAERGAYGRTLLKHLQEFPAARMAAGLVPLITSRHNIKRRIIMITEFKHTGGLARCLFALLFVALGGLTFTRAADDPKPAAPATSPGATSTYAPSGGSFQSAMAPFADTAAGATAPKSGQDYGAEFVKESTLLEQLKSMDGGDRSRFIQVLSVTASDPILNSLLEQIMAQETKLAGMKKSFGLNSPQIAEEVAIINDLREKIDQRANGIIDGMSLKVAALKAAANDGLRRVPASDNALSKRLEDWDHQRVMAEADYLEYSNVLANLNEIPAAQLGKALTTAYAHESDQEMMDLAARVETAKANWAAVTNNYGEEQAVYKKAKTQLKECQAAYQNKIDAVMAGIRTRVNEDKGFLQLIEREEKAIEENRRKQLDDRRY